MRLVKQLSQDCCTYATNTGGVLMRWNIIDSRSSSGEGITVDFQQTFWIFYGGYLANCLETWREGCRMTLLTGWCYTLLCFVLCLLGVPFMIIFAIGVLGGL